MKYRANLTINFDHAFDADDDKDAMAKILALTTMPGIALSTAYGEPRCAWNTLTRIEGDRGD